MTYIKGAFVWEYSGMRIYSGIYSGYSAPGRRIAGMEIQVFRNRKSSQTNANLHYSNYSYCRLIPNERALNKIVPRRLFFTERQEFGSEEILIRVKEVKLQFFFSRRK